MVFTDALPDSVLGDFWASPVEVLVFPSSAGDMSTSFGFLYEIGIYSINSSKTISYIPEILNLQPVILKLNQVHL